MISNYIKSTFQSQSKPPIPHQDSMSPHRKSRFSSHPDSGRSVSASPDAESGPLSLIFMSVTGYYCGGLNFTLPLTVPSVVAISVAFYSEMKSFYHSMLCSYGNITFISLKCVLLCLFCLLSSTHSCILFINAFVVALPSACNSTCFLLHFVKYLIASVNACNVVPMLVQHSKDDVYHSGNVVPMFSSV